MAAFPSSDKTFTTKVDGVDYPQASHINDLQGEVSAVELFLLSATPSGTMWNGKLSVSSSSDFLTYSLLNNAGNVPSSTDPVFININGTIRQVTAQAGFTINPATNWFNSGSAELGTLAVPYFVYAVWDSNSSAVSLTIARKPHYRIVAAAMATTTSENHIYNYSNYTVGDDMANIGYFEAILSLSRTGHLWSVPTFTGDNLRHAPTMRSQRMTWTPTTGGYSADPTGIYEYILDGALMFLYVRETANGTSNATNLTYTAPMTAVTLTGFVWLGIAAAFDNTASLTTTSRVEIPSASNVLTLYPNMSGGSTWTGSGGKRVASGSISYAIG